MIHRLSPLIKVIISFILFMPSSRAETSLDIDSLYSSIRLELDLPSDTSKYFILDLVRTECGEDLSCLETIYSGLMVRFGRDFIIPLEFFLNQEMISIYNENKLLNKLFERYSKHAALGHAMNNLEIMFSSLDKALSTAKEINEPSLILSAEVRQFKFNSTYFSLDELLEKGDIILLKIEKLNGRTDTYGFLCFELAGRLLSLGKLDLAEKYLQLTINIEEKYRSDRFNILSAIWKGDLVLAKGDINSGIQYYERTLEILSSHKDLWLEINSLQKLAGLEWDRANRELAKDYLKKAELLSADLSSSDRVKENFRLKFRFAKDEGRIEDALLFLEQKLFYEETWEKQKEGFNTYQYYYDKEKAAIQEEQARQKKEKQTFLVIISLVILLLLSVTVGLIYQQKQKNKLAVTNKMIRNQANRLKNIDQTKSRFFANISHELRTPLTLIKGPLTSVLASEELTNKNTTLLQLAQENTSNLQTLVNSILDLSKIEAGSMSLKEEPLLLFPLISRILASFESYAQQNDVQLKFEFLADQDLQVELDKGKLETILNNLLSNAVKFTKEGSISLIVEDRRRDILIKVEDTGRGISETDLPYVFNRYFQSEVENAPAEGGTGIGLAFSRELVNLMGGDIYVQSTLDKGSSFFVEIPRKEFTTVNQDKMETGPIRHQAPAFDEKSESFETQVSLNKAKRTILLVEDNSSLQEYLKIVLEDSYNIVLAGNGQEGLDYLNRSLGTKGRTHMPDLIISDVMMPFMDGFQFVKCLKEDTKFNQIPVIMLTARADVKDKLKALRIGVDDYLLKPFNEEELSVRVKNLLRNYDSRTVQVLAEDKDINEAKEAPVFLKEDIEWLAAFEDYVAKNYTRQILNIPLIATEMYMSESSLLRKLKRMTGLSPAKYIQEVRLAKAMSFLTQGTYSTISRVAKEVGYADTRSFSRSFKNRFGKSPSEYFQA